MYFINQKHENNFEELASLYGAKANDVQYQANLYLAAVPEIFSLLDLPRINPANGGPLHTLMAYSEALGELIPTAPGLTGSTTNLLNVGMSLYNGRPCDLDFSPSLEYGKAIIQAVKIRFYLNTYTL